MGMDIFSEMVDEDVGWAEASFRYRLRRISWRSIE